MPSIEWHKKKKSATLHQLSKDGNRSYFTSFIFHPILELCNKGPRKLGKRNFLFPGEPPKSDLNAFTDKQITTDRDIIVA